MSPNPTDATEPRPTALLVLTVLVVAGLALAPALAGAVAAGPDAAPATDDRGAVGIATQNDTAVTLDESVVTATRGEVATLTLNFTGDAEDARVTLGVSEDVSFEVTFTVRDADGDGTAVVRWNTAASDGPDAGLSVAGADEFVDGPTVVDDVDDPVESAEYLVSVVETGTGLETDLGAVVVEDWRLGNLTVHTAPASDGPFADAAAVEEVASSPEVGETIAVADHAQDWVILRLEAPALAVVLDEDPDPLAGSGAVSLNVTETNDTVEMNQVPTTLGPDANATVLRAGENVVYVVFSAAELLGADAGPGAEFVANVTVSDEHELVSTNQSVETTFRLVEGQASFDLADGTLAPAAENATVTGTSTWAPGTELSLHLRSTDASDGATPFVLRADGIVVADDGTWNATVDLSEAAPGQQVTATLHYRRFGVELASEEAELG